MIVVEEKINGPEAVASFLTAVGVLFVLWAVLAGGVPLAYLFYRDVIRRIRKRRRRDDEDLPFADEYQEPPPAIYSHNRKYLP